MLPTFFLIIPPSHKANKPFTTTPQWKQACPLPASDLPYRACSYSSSKYMVLLHLPHRVVRPQIV